MKKVILTAAVLGTLLLTATNASATEMKIGVIDAQQIMQKSTQIAAINSQLTKEFQPRQDKIVALQKAMQNDVDQLNRNSTTMTEADRNKLQDQIVSERSNLQGMMVTFQRDVNSAQTQAMQKFTAQVTAVVNDIAKAQNFDLVLQRNGVPFAKADLDITSEVLDKLNKK